MPRVQEQENHAHIQNPGQYNEPRGEEKTAQKNTWAENNSKLK
jgi:hypothetical protein